MSRTTSPKLAKEPELVTLLREALSERLGRPASSRPSKGSPVRWVVSDPAIYYLQRGKSANPTGYRCGLLCANEEIFFYHEHARATADLLRQNLNSAPQTLLEVATVSAKWRDFHCVRYSSRDMARVSKKFTPAETVDGFECDDWKGFERYLELHAARIPTDLFPELRSVGKGGGPAPHRGTYFQMLIAQKAKLRFGGTQSDKYDVAADIVSAVWPLFSCLYPWEPLLIRRADLSRFMRAARIEKECEYHKIALAPKSDCSYDGLEAAHIVPDRQGGSDRAWNGLWLCKRHHKFTEGLLEGRRDHGDLRKIHVKFKGRSET